MTVACARKLHTAAIPAQQRAPLLIRSYSVHARCSYMLGFCAYCSESPNFPLYVVSMSSRKLLGKKGNSNTGSSSNNSSSRLCELCGCLVPGNEQSWQTHVTGIRHRRNAASHKVFGEAGHAVVSVFENVDAAPSQTYRGRDAVLLAAQQAAAGAAASRTRGSWGATPAAAHRREQTAAAGDPLHEQLQQLQQQLRKHLATQVGVSATYSRAVERFRIDTLSAAAEQLKANISQQLLLQQQQHQHQPSIQVATLQPELIAQPVQVQLQAQQHEQQQHQRQGVGQQQQQHLQGLSLHLCLQDAAQVACLAVLLPASVGRLHLTVPYLSYGPGAAASSAAVACFVSSLAQLHSLQELELHFQCTAYSSILQQGGNSLARLPELWGTTLAALTGAMQVNCGLLRLVFAAYPGQFPVDSVEQLQTCLAASRPALRTAVLLGTHSRAGASSPLLGVPREVLGSLLDMAVPRQACSLHLQLPQGLAGDSSSESESSSDEESSSSSDDSYSIHDSEG